MFDNTDVIAEIPHSRWSRLNTDGYQSLFADGTATITLKQLKREWPTWNSEERRDFCLSYSFAPDDSPNKRKVLQFLVARGDHDCWPAFAHFLPVTLWPDEAVEILCDWASSSPVGKASSYLSALSVLHYRKDCERDVTEARQFLLRYLQDLLFTNGLMNVAPNNEIALEAVACMESLIVLGEDREVLRGVHHLLSHHPCEKTRSLAAGHFGGEFAPR